MSCAPSPTRQDPGRLLSKPQVGAKALISVSSQTAEKGQRSSVTNLSATKCCSPVGGAPRCPHFMEWPRLGCSFVVLVFFLASWPQGLSGLSHWGSYSLSVTSFTTENKLPNIMARVLTHSHRRTNVSAVRLFITFELALTPFLHYLSWKNNPGQHLYKISWFFDFRKSFIFVGVKNYDAVVPKALRGRLEIISRLHNIDCPLAVDEHVS